MVIYSITITDSILSKNTKHKYKARLRQL